MRALIESRSDITQQRFDFAPLIQRRLQSGRNVRHSDEVSERTIHDDELTVPTAGLATRKLHGALPRQLSTYPAHSTARASSLISRASRVSIITAYSSVAGFACVSMF